MKKILKQRERNRGLTFSFSADTGNFSIGQRYDYIISKNSSKPTIHIQANASGKYKISRKKNGKKWDSLIDLRNEAIISSIKKNE